MLSSKTLLNQHNETASPAKEERLDSERKRKVWCFKLFLGLGVVVAPSQMKYQWHSLVSMAQHYKIVPENCVVCSSCNWCWSSTAGGNFALFLSISLHQLLFAFASGTYWSYKCHLPPTSNHFPNQLHFASLRTSFSPLPSLSNFFGKNFKLFLEQKRAEESRRRRRKTGSRRQAELGQPKEELCDWTVRLLLG